MITVFLALLLLIAGTFAWTSISQRALNEKDGENKITSGGRIHDDYSKATGNKDIYGENFGTKDLYVRIKLSEYFEKNGSPLVAGTTKDDKNTWTPYGLPSSAETTAYRDYVTWELGGDKVFLPTFNTDSDNKSTDAAQDAIDVLTGGATAQGNGEHDAFTNGQVVPNDDDATITHIAKPTLTQGRAPISMATWKTLPANEKVGDYWVIDTDGWAYWANTLKPTQATSLLLTQLSYNDEKIGEIEGKWYYGIDVIGEFATEEDKGDFINSDHGAPSTDATDLINVLTKKPTYHVTIMNGEEDLVLKQGDSKQFIASGMVIDFEGNETLVETPITWSVSPEEVANISTDGTVTISSELEEETTVTVTATAPAFNKQTTFTFTVSPITVEIGAIGEEFDFFGETYIHLKDLGEGNHLVQRKYLLELADKTTTNTYNGGALDLAMKSYYEGLSNAAKSMVQPVQSNFTVGQGGTPVTQSLLASNLPNDHAVVTPDGEKKAFALSASELNSVSGSGLAYPNAESRIARYESGSSGGLWRTRTALNSTYNWVITDAGNIFAGDRGRWTENTTTAYDHGLRPAMIIHL